MLGKTEDRGLRGKVRDCQPEPTENQGILPQKPGGGAKGLQAAIVSLLRLSLQTLKNRRY